MAFSLPRIPSFRISWRSADMPAIPPASSTRSSTHQDTSQRRRMSSRSRSSQRMSSASEPKSPDTPLPPHAQMPSILGRIASPAPAQPTARREPTRIPQMMVTELPRIQTYPSQSIMAQDMHPVQSSANQNSSSATNPTRRTAGTIEVPTMREVVKGWWNKPELKTRVAILLVWSAVFIIVLSIYLGLFMNDKLQAPPLQISLILITLMAAFFFFHALIRVCLAVARPFSYPDEEQPSNYHNTAFDGMVSGPGPFGYAQPARPIRVHPVNGQSGAALEEDGVPKDLPPPPPAYGIWRQSVRVNPDQFYWVRRSQTGGVVQTESIEEETENRSERNSVGIRPPSYSSRHRAEFHRQQEEALRSPPPSRHSHIPPHPSEVGRLPGRLPNHSWQPSPRTLT